MPPEPQPPPRPNGGRPVPRVCVMHVLAASYEVARAESGALVPPGEVGWGEFGPTGESSTR